MEKRKDKGFTLIELLVTILILSLVSTIAFFVSKNAIDTSNTKKNDANLDSIKKSAVLYTEEFKSDDKYWYYGDTDTEYACTTVGMLINRGFLKEKILDTKIDENAVTRDTSVKVIRDKNTKVMSKEDISYNSISCDEEADINLIFSVDGDKGLNNWYKGDVTITITASNSSQIDSSSYTISNESVDNNVINPSIIGNANSSSWQIQVDTEGKNNDVCVNVITRKDNVRTFCLADHNMQYNMDKTAPNPPVISLKDGESYYLESSGSTDNLSKLIYYFTYDEEREESRHDIPLNTNVSDKVVSSYVMDEAGNKSSVTTKKLNISNSITEEVIQNTKYYCSLNNNEYSSLSDAQSACNQTVSGELSSKTTYKCSLNDNDYSTEKKAKEKCSKTEEGTTSSYYKCKYGDSRSGTTCTSSRSESGFGKILLKCASDKIWKDVPAESNYTNNGCPYGYTKVDADSWCEPFANVPYWHEPCSSLGETRYEIRNCQNTCVKTYDADYVCSCSIYGKSCDDCSTTSYGDVTSITRYTCSLNEQVGTDYNTIKNSCTKTESGNTSSKTFYTCPIDNSVSENKSEIEDKCTNYCKLGTYYEKDGNCYSLN